MTAVDTEDPRYTPDPDEPADDEPDLDQPEDEDEPTPDDEPYRPLVSLPDIANYQDRNDT